MAFFRALKRAFGFSDDGLETNDELDGINGAQAARRPYINPFADDDKQTSTPASKHNETTHSTRVDDLSQQLLTQVIAIVNRNLPPFVLDNLDLEAERKAIGDELRPSVDTFVAKLSDEAKSQADNDKSEIAQLNEKIKNVEAQRRAVLAKFNDAQNKVATLEAEREQFQLENKSLLNKIKVMKVKAGDTDFGDIDQAVASYDDSKRQLESLTQEYKQKMELTNALVSELRADAAQKAQQVKELTASLEQAQQQVEQLQAQCQSQKAQLDEVQDDADIIDEVQAKIQEFEQFKLNKQQEIADLQQKLKQAQSSTGNASNQLDDYKKRVTELEKTIDKLTRHAAETAERHNRRDIEVANRYNDLKTSYGEIQNKLNEAKAEIERLNAEASVTQGVVDEMMRKNETLTLKCRDTNAMLTLAQDELEDAREQLDAAQSRIAILESAQTAINDSPSPQSQVVETLVPEEKLDAIDISSAVEAEPEPSVPEPAEPEETPVPEEKPEAIDISSAIEAEPDLSVPEPAEPEGTQVPEEKPEAIDISSALETELEPSVPEPAELDESTEISKDLDTATSQPASPTSINETPSALDTMDMLDDIDWLVPTPPSSKPKEPEQPEPQPQPVQRKSQPGDRQMSLF